MIIMIAIVFYEPRMIERFADSLRCIYIIPVDLYKLTYDWGEPERAPHEREVWCWDAIYVYMYFVSYVLPRGDRDNF